MKKEKNYIKVEMSVEALFRLVELIKNKYDNEGVDDIIPSCDFQEDKITWTIDEDGNIMHKKLVMKFQTTEVFDICI